MRDIKYIVIHCTATDQTATVESIKRYWKEKLGWKSPGYHFIFEPDGNMTQLQHLDKPSNGVRGYNQQSIHLSYIGGKDEDDRTEAQKKSMYKMVKKLKQTYPDAEVLGHRDFPKVSKSCPRFDVKEWYKS
jgi:N-acetylmuramoyl-L-alanine amidase